MSAAPPETKVLVLALGGTISMTTAATGGVSPSLGAAALLEHVPVTVSVETRDVWTVPGAHLTLPNVIELAEIIADAGRHGFHGAVVVQGTDTIEETSFALDLLTDGSVVTVVTGAMRNASAPGADGPANLVDAITVAADPGCRGLGALVVFSGEIHAAGLVRKAHTVAPHAFESHPGALGWVIEGTPTVRLRPADRFQLPEGLAAMRPSVPEVELVTALLGAGAHPIERLSADLPAGLVVEGFGAGHVPPAWVAPLESLAARVPVVLCSRTRRGPLLRETYSFPGSERDLLSRGLLVSGMDAPKTAIALRLLLAAGADAATIADAFS